MNDVGSRGTPYCVYIASLSLDVRTHESYREIQSASQWFAGSERGRHITSEEGREGE